MRWISVLQHFSFNVFLRIMLRYVSSQGKNHSDLHTIKTCWSHRHYITLQMNVEGEKISSSIDLKCIYLRNPAHLKDIFNLFTRI